MKYLKMLKLVLGYLLFTHLQDPYASVIPPNWKNRITYRKKKQSGGALRPLPQSFYFVSSEVDSISCASSSSSSAKEVPKLSTGASTPSTPSSAASSSSSSRSSSLGGSIGSAGSIATVR